MSRRIIIRRQIRKVPVRITIRRQVRITTIVRSK